MSQSWPSTYPADCPPEQALDANGTFYRLVKNDPPAREDFRTLAEQYPSRRFSTKPSPKSGVSELVKAHGLSLMADKEDVIRLRRAVPAYRDGLLGKGDLVPDHGKVLATPSQSGRSHHTWWTYDGAEPEAAFVVVAEPEDD